MNPNYFLKSEMVTRTQQDFNQSIDYINPLDDKAINRPDSNSPNKFKKLDGRREKLFNKLSKSVIAPSVEYESSILSSYYKKKFKLNKDSFY
jgi:hypothetical protein